MVKILQGVTQKVNNYLGIFLTNKTLINTSTKPLQITTLNSRVFKLLTAIKPIINLKTSQVIRLNISYTSYKSLLLYPKQAKQIPQDTGEPKGFPVILNLTLFYRNSNYMLKKLFYLLLCSPFLRITNSRKVTIMTLRLTNPRLFGIKSTPKQLTTFTQQDQANSRKISI
jgi:hypothetical protein